MTSSVFSFTPPPREAPGRLRVAIPPAVSCRDWPATAGTRALETFVALEDAHVIVCLKTADITLSGMTHSAELGFGLRHDTGTRAIRENLADAVLFTDSMGEARVAAARAGLTGYKPGPGIVSRHGRNDLTPSLADWGIAARNLADIHQLISVMSVPDDRDVIQVPAGSLPDFTAGPEPRTACPVIGVADGYETGLTPPESRAWQQAVTRLRDAGCRIQKVPLPDPALFTGVHHLIAAVEASSSAGRYDGVRYGHRTETADTWNEMYLKTRGESFGPLIKAFLFQGACIQFQRYDAFDHACRIRTHLRDTLLTALTQVDALASLTRRNQPDAVHADTLSDTFAAFGFTLPANVTGLPAVHLPGLARDGSADFGLHLMGSPLGDPALLALARNLTPPAQGEPAP